MSLDVYLTGQLTLTTGTGVFIRENGERRELSRSEVKARFPDSEIDETSSLSSTVFAGNITSNLVPMAKLVGLYRILWYPEQLDFKVAKDMIEPLNVGLTILHRQKEDCEKLNPENGWGNYDQLVQFVIRYLAACRANPDATVHVSR